jgi:hypothetical protein
MATKPRVANCLREYNRSIINPYEKDSVSLRRNLYHFTHGLYFIQRSNYREQCGNNRAHERDTIRTDQHHHQEGR